MKNNSNFIRQRAYIAVLHLLDSILAGGKYPDILLGELFKEEKFSSGEKAIVVEFVYGILRHLGRIDYIIEHASRARICGLHLSIINIIRICTYQAMVTQTSPAGVINNAVALSAQENKFSEFVKRTVEGVIKNKDGVIFPDKDKNAVEYISVYHSHPSWIVEKWLKEFHDAGVVEALCTANNHEPPLTIRANPLKTNRTLLQSSLEQEGYSSSPTVFSPFGLVVDKKEGIFKTDAFANGAFEVQDEGSQLIALLTGAKPGECVVDACAGNGGKSLFLSGLMNNHGTVIAFDPLPGKLGNLRRRAERAGALNIKTEPVDKAQQYIGKADCVFIDAPCSGMGVFRRNPDSKWRLAEKDITELSAKQKEILREYSGLVKPGGRLVYATCTISREENEEVVRGFLEENMDFHMVPASEMNPEIFGRFTTEEGFFKSLPHIHGTDGFFGTVMRRR
ncbi:MAG: 16S rRNA (cytosine(967)-C(5))-methyltransferase RsmB [Candidatus Methanoperedens sp.]|nr:16S rRNA (cytosine(967)-C(5))-methyltransferase RsmB [Candidatus Methanoperedens sp.]